MRRPRTIAAHVTARLETFRDHPPQEVCILRLSAIGDTCHALPVVRTLQRAWPQTRFTWVIGGAEAALMAGIDGVELAVLDKSAAAGGFMGLRRHLAGRRFDLLLMMHASLRANLTSLMISASVRLGFDRPRPDLVAHAVDVYTTSFPSSHAMLSTVTYLTLGALLARLQERRRLKIYIMGTAAAIALLIGFSRVFLGVHWPTDVLAGWCVGAAWALGCWVMTAWLQRRGKVEHAAEHGENEELEHPGTSVRRGSTVGTGARGEGLRPLTAARDRG